MRPLMEGDDTGVKDSGSARSHFPLAGHNSSLRTSAKRAAALAVSAREYRLSWFFPDIGRLFSCQAGRHAGNQFCGRYAQGICKGCDRGITI
jgi:hypothetical protein